MESRWVAVHSRNHVNGYWKAIKRMFINKTVGQIWWFRLNELLRLNGERHSQAIKWISEMIFLFRADRKLKSRNLFFLLSFIETQINVEGKISVHDLHKMRHARDYFLFRKKIRGMRANVTQHNDRDNLVWGWDDHSWIAFDYNLSAALMFILVQKKTHT